MEVIIINGNYIFSEDDFFNSLCKQVPELGCYFGRNLDALNDYIDLLSGKKILWGNFNLSLERLGSDFMEWLFYIIENYNSYIKDENEYIVLECI